MNAGSVALIEITPALGELLHDPAAFEQTYGARLGDHADAIGELVRANVEFLARVPDRFAQSSSAGPCAGPRIFMLSISTTSEKAIAK